jgi:TonB family protein
LTAEQAGGAAKPGQVTPGPKTIAQPSKPAVTKLKDVRPVFPAGSPEARVIVKVETDASGAVTGATPVGGSTDLADIAIAAVKQWKFSPGHPLAFLVGFNPAAGADDLRDQPPILVGGNVRPPTKIKDVKPVYPDDAQQARVQGVVILETRIAASGAVSDARILRSVPLLDIAALEAVLAWKFAPAGFPVQMTVTVNFVLDGGPPSGVKGGVPGGVAGGVPGSVAGGVPGGVAGGVAGGETDAPKWATLANGDRALRIGGQVKAPEKIVDVKPVYPKDAKDARVQGVVIIETAIGPDGKVKETKILRSVPMLDEAALEAVRQWEFVPTLLNGVAQTVIMTVTVNFTLQ